MFSFYQITDLHYYAADVLKPQGDAWEYRAKYDQKCVAESGAILDATIDKLLADKETEVVLISGDLVSDGEREGHHALIPKLRRLTAGGKRVYVITATHDVAPYPPYPKTYFADRGEVQSEGLEKPKLLELYWEFGPADALSVHRESFSYVTKIAPNIRLFALNDDGVGWERGFHGYLESELQWLKEQLEEGKKSGDILLAMGHHPLLKPSPVYSPADEILGDNEKIAALLADAGVHFMFTGHTHMQNISCFDSPNGNRIFDINTASLIGYPSPIRKMTLTEETLTVETQHIDKLDWDLGGKSYLEYSKDHFEFMLRDIFDAAAHDIRHFCEISQGFSLSKEKAWKLRVPISAAGKLMDKLTFGKAARILCCSKKIHPAVRDRRLCDFVIDVVRNIYAGDEPYAPDTPEYISFTALAKPLMPILRRALKTPDPQAFLDGILYNSGYPDNDAVLPVPKTVK